MKDLLPILPAAVNVPRPLIVAGPCSAESEHQLLDTAEALAALGVKVFRAGVWKPRTHPGDFEGVGAEALPWLAKVKALTGMLITTEVANEEHVRLALDSGIDILWVGARTTANPFAVQEIADAVKDSGKDVPVLVKNPVNPDLELWIGAFERLYNAGVRRLGAIHRGFSVYGSHLYRNMPQWRIPIELRRRFPALPLLCDPSHMGGCRALVAPLSQQALDMGYDGLFVESHCRPDDALSDKRQQLTPGQLREIVSGLVVRDASVSTEYLELLRRQIDELDDELLEVLGRRMRVAEEIGRYKRDNSMSVVQIDRHNDIMNRRADMADRLNLSPDFVRGIMSAIHEESVRRQLQVLTPPEKQ